MSEMAPKAVVLLSGGLDSTTVLAMAKAEGFETYALSFCYGQRHSWELECARRVATASGVSDHRIAQIRFDELNRTSPSEMAHGPRFERANLPGVPQTRPLSTLPWQ
jgi:7-cyano-7-deazaguanine synthase